MSTHVPFASLCPAGLIQSTRALLSSLHAPHGILPSSSVNPSSISIHVLFLRRGSTRINLSQIRACAAQSASYFTSSLFDTTSKALIDEIEPHEHARCNSPSVSWGGWVSTHTRVNGLSVCLSVCLSVSLRRNAVSQQISLGSLCAIAKSRSVAGSRQDLCHSQCQSCPTSHPSPRLSYP